MHTGAKKNFAARTMNMQTYKNQGQTKKNLIHVSGELADDASKNLGAT